MFLDELSRVLGLKLPADRKIELAQKETDKILLVEEELERQRILALHERYVGLEDVGIGKYIEYLSNEETISLNKARNNERILDRPFRSLNIVKITPATDGTPAEAYLRFGNVASPKYKVRRGYISGNFQQILLTNTAQPGASITYIISQKADVRFNMLEDEGIVVSTVPHIFVVAMTLAGSEYKQALPPGTTYMKAHLNDNTAYMFAFEPDCVAGAGASILQPADVPFVLNGMRFEGRTFYFTSDTADKYMMILVLQ